MGLVFQKKRDIYRSVLSNVSLGIPPEYVPVTERSLGSYKRKGVRITRFLKPRTCAFPRFRLVIDPKKGWFASSMAYYILHTSVQRDIGVLISRIPKAFNPSGWIKNYQECYAIGVPKDRKAEMREWLRKEGYYLDTKCNRWKKFFNHQQKRILKKKLQ